MVLHGYGQIVSLYNNLAKDNVISDSDLLEVIDKTPFSREKESLQESNPILLQEKKRVVLDRMRKKFLDAKITPPPKYIETSVQVWLSDYKDGEYKICMTNDCKIRFPRNIPNSESVEGRYEFWPIYKSGQYTATATREQAIKIEDAINRGANLERYGRTLLGQPYSQPARELRAIAKFEITDAKIEADGIEKKVVKGRLALLRVTNSISGTTPQHHSKYLFPGDTLLLISITPSD